MTAPRAGRSNGQSADPKLAAELGRRGGLARAAKARERAREVANDGTPSRGTRRRKKGRDA
jgi:general stress protein YciG